MEVSFNGGARLPSPLWGGGCPPSPPAKAGWGRGFQELTDCILNRRKCGRGIGDDVGVAHSYHDKSVRSQKAVALLIPHIAALQLMRSAINLDRYSCREPGEVDDVRTDRNLSPEVRAKSTK
jgi:hypothetical protein